MRMEGPGIQISITIFKELKIFILKAESFTYKYLFILLIEGLNLNRLKRALFLDNVGIPFPVDKIS